MAQVNLIDQWNSMGDMVDPYQWLQQSTQSKTPPSQTSQKTNPKKGSKNQSFASSLISEAGGTGGAIGGAALGTMILPGIGTVIGGGLGGLLGGFTGRAAENQIRDGEVRVGDALKEGALSGAFGAGPGNVLKAVKGGSSALAGGGARTLESALVNAGEQAAQAPLKTSLKGKMLNASDSLIRSQYDTVGKNVARSIDPATFRNLANVGIVKPQDAERVANAVTGADGIINKAVLKATGGAGKVPTGNVVKVADEAINDLGLVDSDAKSVMAIVNAQLGRLGTGTEAEPAKVLQVMKSLEQRAADLKGKGGNYKMTDPVRIDKAKALLRVRNELQTQLETTAGANANLSSVLTPELRNQLVNLNPKNTAWMKHVDKDIMKSPDISTLRSTMAPFVNIRKLIDEGEVNSLTAGGRFGNWLASGGQGGIAGPAAAIGIGLTKNPAARLTSSALRSAAGQGSGLVAPTSLGIAARGAIGGGLHAAGETAGAMKAGVPAFNAGMSDGATMPTDQPQDLTSALMGVQGGSANPAADIMQPEEASQSPYSRENLLADLQRDPKNAEKYMSYYAGLQEIFNPAQKEAKGLNATQQQQANTAQSGIDSLNIVAQELQKNPNAAGLASLPGGSVTGRLTGTGSYRAAVANAVDAIGRLRSGGAIQADEEARFRSLLPAMGDDPQTIRFKIGQLNNIFAPFANPQTGASSLEDALMNQQGAYN